MENNLALIDWKQDVPPHSLIHNGIQPVRKTFVKLFASSGVAGWGYEHADRLPCLRALSALRVADDRVMPSVGGREFWLTEAAREMVAVFSR